MRSGHHISPDIMKGWHCSANKISQLLGRAIRLLFRLHYAISWCNVNWKARLILPRSLVFRRLYPAAASTTLPAARNPWAQRLQLRHACVVADDLEAMLQQPCGHSTPQ